jgi:hypothetical protein
VSECLGRVLINAQIAAGYARLLCGYVTTSTQYWYFWLQLSKKQQLTELRCTTNARGGCGGLSQGGNDHEIEARRGVSHRLAAAR